MTTILTSASAAVLVFLSAVPAKALQQSISVMVRNAAGQDEAHLFSPGAGKSESFRDCVNRREVQPYFGEGNAAAQVTNGICTDSPEMVVIPAGSFVMGSLDEELDGVPRRNLTIQKPFAVGKYAITFAEWDACVVDGGCGGYKPSDKRWGREARPVINVNWDDAQAYVKWLSRKTQKTYRLLSEAEREYVTRAGTTTPYWWGSTISPDQANYNASKTMPVKSFQPNPWGLYQVHSNVAEWVEDCWSETRKDGPADGAAITQGCDLITDYNNPRVVRGASWNSDPVMITATHRDQCHQGNRLDDVGFRVARTF